MKYTDALNLMNDRIAKSINDNTSSATYSLLLENRVLASHVAALENMMTNPSPYDTEAAHKSKVAVAAKKVEQRLSATRKKADDIMMNGGRELALQIEEQAGLKDSVYGAEIRATLRSMTNEARSDAIQAALERNDSQLIGAMVSAPALLSGVQPEIQERARDVLTQRLAPQAKQEFSNLQEAWSTVNSSAKMVETVIREAVPVDEINQINRAQEKALTAQADFSRSVDG